MRHAFPLNTVRKWNRGHVVKSTEGWSPLHRTLRQHISELRAITLSPEDERRRQRLKQFWTKQTPSGQSWPKR